MGGGRGSELGRLLRGEGLHAVADVVDALAEDPAAVDPQALADARRWAEKTSRSGKTASERSTARAVAALVARTSVCPSSTRRTRSPARRVALTLGGAVLVAGIAAGGVTAGRRALMPSLEVQASYRTPTVGAAGLRTLAFTSRGHAARWLLDGEDVTGSVAKGVFRPGPLGEGNHVLEIASAGGFLGLRRTRRLRFTVDLTPPEVSLQPLRTRRWEPLHVRGTTEDGARVEIGDTVVPVRDGRFATTLPAPVPRRLTLEVTDAAGNSSVSRAPVKVEPRRPAVPVRAVHVTAVAWAYEPLRKGILKLIDEKRINAVELDLKDESGEIGFDPKLPYAKKIGATKAYYDLGAVVKELHARGVRVIGRLVCFRDAVLAKAAWDAGQRDEVIQTPAGKPYAGYGGFTNFADEKVRAYNIDVAVAAAKLGVDDVLYDYVRRPDGPLSSMRFPGLKGTPEAAIVGFLRETRLALRPYGTFFGASVFGVAATRPTEVAQDIPAMARQVDYIAPMVYPSHWGRGEYGLADPNAEPYEIVLRSLRDFRRDLAGSGARLVPWLQDFSLGRSYGPAEVRAQIDAARKVGADEFLLWDAAVTYTADALTPDAPTSTAGLARAAS
ncbi:MAG TPA: putative glycoside hydrolase [Gaiellaceae bacterium]|nr:putative glycoside hydrolase [Gaiellaceae bacterium]